MPPSLSKKICFYEWLDRCTVEFDRGDISLRITFLEDAIIRCHYVKGQIFESVPSYGVDPRFKKQLPLLTELESEQYIEIRSSSLNLRVRKSDMGLEFYDLATGALLSADAEGMGHRPDTSTGDDIVWMLKRMPKKAHFFGLGDKPTSLNLRGKRLELWNCDHYSFKEDGDPLYKSIPFFVCLNEGLSHGIFFDNSMRSYFDFGKDRYDRLLFGADGGQMDYYFIGGKRAIDVIANYTRLTGLPSMPPLWALGYQQSRWGYNNQETVEQIAETFREKRIPCDVIHLDIDHMDEHQSLTWDKERFPSPERMVSYLATLGMKSVTIVNPGIKIDPDQYIWRSGFEQNVFCRRHDGALFEGKVWPGYCHFPDFTSRHVRGWWAELLDRQIVEKGIHGFWVDMNEPSLHDDSEGSPKYIPKDLRHDYDGYPCSHLKAHNVYGQAMAQATRDAMRRHAPERRPFVLSRAGYAGLQRHAATWTGDNVADWSHLKMANTMMQRLATSGVSFCGSDTGGFIDKPSPELYCRWMQLSAFHLFFRTHCDGKHGEREPWSFGAQAEQHCRLAIEERYRLLPYFYTQFYRYATEGLAIIRSLAIQHCELVDHYWRSNEFFVGEALYIIPVQHSGEIRRDLFLPPGDWYSLWTDEYLGEGGCNIAVTTPRAHIPVLVRAGSIIPRWPVQQYVGEIARPRVSYELWWTDQGEVESYHYEDAGDGDEDESTVYLYHHFLYQAEQGEMTLSHDWAGDIRLEGQSHVDLIIHGLPARCWLDLLIDEEIEQRLESDEHGVLRVELARFFQQVELTLPAT